MDTGHQYAGDRGELSGAPGRRRDLIVVGASAGGVAALQAFVHGLPADLPAAVLVVMHMRAAGPGKLAGILQRQTMLPVGRAEDMTPVRPGRIYVARPGCHLLLRDGEIRLGRGAHENGHRPAVDALFRSAARWYGPRTVSVVLSGALDDGAAGAAAVARRGGAAAVQDPADALFDGMPTATLQAVPSAVTAPLAELPAAVVRLLREPASPGASEVTRQLTIETDMAELTSQALRDPDRPGTPSELSCPDCHGILYDIDDPAVPRYRCRVGHAWSLQSLAVFQDQRQGAAPCCRGHPRPAARRLP